MYLKQKLDVKSYTEGDIVGAHDGLILVLRTKKLIYGQSYTVEHNKLYQDNKITILMEKNGIASISKITKHTKEQYLFIKRHIDQGEWKLNIYLHKNVG